MTTVDILSTDFEDRLKDFKLLKLSIEFLENLFVINVLKYINSIMKNIFCKNVFYLTIRCEPHKSMTRAAVWPSLLYINIKWIALISINDSMLEFSERK